MHEFDLIQRYFAPLSQTSGFVQLGQGDDCAAFTPGSGQQCLVSTDTLVSGVHFFPTLVPEKLARRALAVNLSDLAAMGATARAFTLAITLPEVDEPWLSAFSHSLASSAQHYGVVLMGGDTTKGPLSLTMTVFGEVPQGQGLLRSAAQEGDDLWVSGELGAAWCGLQLRSSSQPDWLRFSPAAQELALDAFECPKPRLSLGEAIREMGGTAAMDLSDGLVGDAAHLARASGKSLSIDLDEIPVFAPLREAAPDIQTAWRYALAGGDDYELLFCVPKRLRHKVEGLSGQLGLSLTRVGGVNALAAEPIYFSSKTLADHVELRGLGWSSYNHFPSGS